jgi:MoxR-like ATPase
MRYADIKQSITRQFQTTNKVVPYIEGAPGGGKSALAKEIGRELGFDRVEMFFASLRDPVDLLGTPSNSGEYTTWKPPEELALLQTGRNLLILDELSDALTPMQNALCGLILEGKVNKLKLSDQTHIIATGNRTKDKSGANRVVSKLRGRVRTFEFTENIDDWSEWALKQRHRHSSYSVLAVQT